MKIEETTLVGCYIIEPKVFRDQRGEFFETYNKSTFQEFAGIEKEFVQDNQSISKKGVLRGLHFQEGEHAQAKLVRVVQGSILDVCVDLRYNSKTFGSHIAVVLDSKENKQIYVPKGFAHGFLTLSEEAIVNYKCDNLYNKSSENGIIYNDVDLNIDWTFNGTTPILSEKDLMLPTLQQLLNERED